MPRWAQVLSVVVVALVLASIVAVGFASMGPTHSGGILPSGELGSSAPSVEPPVAALTVTYPQVFVSPATNLADGQPVMVRVTGFGVGGKVWISECATAASANGLGCGTQLAAQTLIATDNLRAGSASFTVHATAQAGPYNTGAIEACSDQCVIVATLGGGFGFAYQGITFERP